MAARLSRIVFLMLLIASFGVGSSLAQDDHYWKLSYGTEATLLNGAVIGRTLDMSAAFYNPAGIATIDNASLLLGAHTYEYGGVKVNGTDEFTEKPINAGTSALRPAPSFIGGTVPFPSLGRHRIAYSVLARQKAESRLAYRKGVTEDGERTQFEYLNDNELSESWFGLSWAYGFSDGAAVGATLFTAVRSQLLRRQLTAQVLYENNDVGLASGISEFDYNSWRFVPKLGAMFGGKPLSVGATVTLPSLGLFGSGSSLYNATSTGIDLDGDGQEDQVLSADFQDEVPTDFTSGLSVGLGAAWDVGTTTLFGSAEWFADRGPTRVVDSDPFTSQSTGETLSNDLILNNKAVLNGTLGIRHKFSDKVSGYLSAATDFTAVDTTSNVSVARTPWDLYHIGGGAKVTIRHLELVFGGAYTFGGTDLTTDNAAGLPLLGGATVDVTERGFRFLFGFEFGFGKDSGKSANQEKAPSSTTPNP